jgi:hypothetical protein
MAISALAVNGNGELLAGTSGGGIFKSTDGGNLWATSNAGLTTLYVTSLASDNGSTVYAGTLGLLGGGGVFRSTDNGSNWALASNGLASFNITNLAVASPTGIYAGSLGGGIARSTDQGSTWVPLTNGLPGSDITGLFASPGGEIFAGVSLNGIYRSTDQGANWAAVNSGLKNLNTTAIALDSSAVLYTGTNGSGVSRSTSVISFTKVAMRTGWNMVSVPRVPSSYNATSLFPGAEPGSIYGFNGSAYGVASVLQSGPGYWALYRAPATNTIGGTALTSVSVVVTGVTGGPPRWILIGSVTSPTLPTRVTSTPPGRIEPGTLYSFDGLAYQSPVSIDPGVGYWLLLNGDCTVTISQ